MLRETKRKGPGSLTNTDEAARLTGDGIYQVVALTRKRPLDGHVTIGTSDGGVREQMGGMPCLYLSHAKHMHAHILTHPYTLNHV